MRASPHINRGTDLIVWILQFMEIKTLPVVFAFMADGIGGRVDLWCHQRRMPRPSVEAPRFVATIQLRA